MSTTDIPLEIDIKDSNYSIPLIYDDTIDTTNMENILLIDSVITDYNSLYNDCNSNTFPIIYSNYSIKTELLTLLQNKFKSIKRIAFAFHSLSPNFYYRFLNSSQLFNSDDIDAINNNTETLSDNINFIVNLITTFNIINIDFLACSTLLYNNWSIYYEYLHNKTGVIVGASNDLTGNIKYGANWILESTNQDIINIYFTDEILNYNETLIGITLSCTGNLYIKQVGSIVQYQINSTSGTWTNISWPVTLINSNPVSSSILNVMFTTDINLSTTNSSSNWYFIINSQNINIVGTTITKFNVTTLTNFAGLIQNGTSGTASSNYGYSNITIQNISFNCDSSSRSLSGWITQDYYSNNAINNVIRSCNSNGQITILMGAICGQYTPTNYGLMNIYNCYSTGNIINDRNGGILGNNACTSNAVLNIYNCYSTGIIGGDNTCGGICPLYSGAGGKLYISNCYSTGNINNGAGGIIGALSAATIINCFSTGNINSSGGISANGAGQSQILNIINCFSTGNITGANSGGISAIGGAYNGTINISNCYSTGNINNNASGIFYATNQTYCNITNCYSLGTITNNSCGICIGGGTYINITNSYSLGSYDTTSSGIINSASSPLYVFNNIYSANGTWNYTDAFSKLTISTNVWTIYSYSKPFLLTSFNKQIYDQNIISTSNSSYTSNVAKYTGYYSIVSVNASITIPSNISINTVNGVITINNINNNYVIIILSYNLDPNGNFISYNINNFTLKYLNSIITTHPISQIVTGSNATLSVTASGSNLSYQWYITIAGTLNSTISGATSNSYNTSNYGIYYVVITDSYSNITNSIYTYVSFVTAQPQSQFLYGNYVNIYISINTLDILSYQWYYKGNMITTIDANQNNYYATNYGNYYVIVTSQTGNSYTSSNGNITIIVAQPSSYIINNGNSATMTISLLTTDLSLTYLWKLPGGGSVYGSSSYTTSTFGSYYVIVTNSNNQSYQSSISYISIITSQPQSKIVSTGPINLNITISTTDTLTYQWYNTTAGAISGATNNSYQISNYGTFYVIVTGSNGNTTNSSNVYLSYITSQPQSQIISTSTGTLSITVLTTDNTISYQWYNTLGLISGATSNSYTTSNYGTYYIKLNSSYSSSYTSSNAYLSIITLQPQSYLINSGNNVTFSISISTTDTLSYQWYNIINKLISGATTNSYNTSNYGTYYVIVTGSNGNIKNSSNAYLSLISLSPLSQIISSNTGTLSITVLTNDSTISYKWYNTITGLISSATSNSYSTSNYGIYYVVLNSSYSNSYTSSNAYLSFITLQPQSQNINEFSSLQLSSTVLSSDIITYQWYYNDNIISDATNNTYNIPNITITNSGSYSVLLTNSSGVSTLSSYAIIIVNILPLTIQVQPICKVLNTTESVTLNVIATATHTLTYQWYLNNGIIPNANNYKYITSTNGTYYVILTNSL